MGKKVKELRPQSEAKPSPEQKAIAVIATGGLLIIQPNFDISAGAVITVDPRRSGVQTVGNAQEPTEATSPADDDGE